MRTFIIFILGACLSLQVQGEHRGSAPKYEIRADWITTLGGLDWPSCKATSAAGIARQKQELCDILDRLKAAHFNTVLLQVRLRGDVIYPSAIEGFAESLTGFTGRSPGYDPLQFAIDACHKRGLELHAWMVMIPVGSVRQVKLQGRNSIVARQPGICKLYRGTWYLDPGNPAASDYLSRIVAEVVSRYDIDGVHFDYIRYPENPEAFPDGDTYRKYGRKQPLAMWRRDNITAIVRRIYKEVKERKPWVKVSSSPVGKYRDTQRYPSHGWNAYHTVYQDAQRWLREGIHDILFPMMYFRRNHFYPFALDWKENCAGRWVVPGLGIYFLRDQDWALDEIVRQVYFTRSIGLNGQAYFRNRFLLDNAKGVLDELKERFYVYPAVLPPMTWGDSIAPSVPVRPLMTVKDDQVTFSWGASADNMQLPVTYRLYASNAYPVDVQDATCLRETCLHDTRYTFMPDYPWQQRLYWAVTAVDRFGNESRPLALNTPGTFIGPQVWGDVPIPPLSEGDTLVVTDATGEEVKRIRRVDANALSDLGHGLFFFRIEGRDGKVKQLGAHVQ